MADAVLSGITVEIIKKLGSLVHQKTKLYLGVKEELEKLRRTVSTIQAVLLDAEEQYWQSHQVKDWVDSLKEAFYDADDLLDEFSTDVLYKQMMIGDRMVKEVRFFFSSSNPFAYGLKMAYKIEKIRNKLDEIVANRKFHLNERNEIPTPRVEEREQTHSSLPQVVVGREDDNEKIIDFLLDSSYEENVSIISIVGIGGQGKTTLAQLAFNDEKVKSNFELKMWVHVSEKFDVKEIVEKILESPYVGKHGNLNTLKDLLHEKINRKKYLLVLDDLWNQDSEKWFKLKDLLAGGASGSKIIVTARYQMVSEIIRSEETHYLEGLPVDESWSLLKKMAFKPGQVPSLQHEKVGREIVEMCGRVPLAISVIGRVLYFTNTIDEWQLLKAKGFSNLNEGENKIMQTLKLSYTHLPSHLKRCFAYYSLLPKGFQIDVTYLVSLWMAQGFIKSSDLTQSLRDKGLEYLKDLVWRSFFQIVEKDDLDNVIFVKMHDLMYDLAKLVAKEENVSLNSDANSFEGVRHLLIDSDVESWRKVTERLPSATKLRSFISWSTKQDEEECHEIFSQLSCVRVLILWGMRFERLPPSIVKLIHIRFLDLSYSEGIEILPDSIIKLQNLHILILIDCKRLKQLPKHIKKLVNLQRLNLGGCVALTHMPLGIGQLTSLERLSMFMVAKDNSIHKRSGGLSELRYLNNLREDLEILNLLYVKNPASEFEAANLKEKQHLPSLKLAWKLGEPYEDDDSDAENDREISLEELHPHFNLKGLRVYGSGRLVFPSWISSLTNLVELVLDNCIRCQHFPPLDQFPSLKTLCIRDFTDLEYIESEINCDSALFFPSLEKLWLFNCPNLKGWRSLTSTSQSLQFHCLLYLEVKSCPNLTTMPLIPSVQELALTNASKKSLENILKMNISVSPSTSSCSSVSPSELQLLHIEGIEDLELLPEELLTNLTSVQRLDIRYCPRLTKVSSALRHLASLETLVFVACEELDLLYLEDHSDMPWQCLGRLQQLAFSNLSKLASLPKGLQHLPTLSRLTITSCPNLTSLPDWIKSITGLQYFCILECPQISERCKNNMGADWPKIARIPNIIIDKIWIQEDGCYKL